MREHADEVPYGMGAGRFGVLILALIGYAGAIFRIAGEIVTANSLLPGAEYAITGAVMATLIATIHLLWK